jgi:hypothetical protein
LSNAALAREGLALAVDHRSLAARGLDRDPARYQASDTADEARTRAYRHQLRESGTTAFEALRTYAGWQDQAVKLLSLDRQYITDLARDHVWRYDRSPARTLEREQSLQRTLGLAMRNRQPTRDRTLERTPERTPTRQVGHVRQPLRDLAGALDRLDNEGPQGGGLRMRIFRDREDEREHDRGMSW